jgi:hypothetical protein
MDIIEVDILSLTSNKRMEVRGRSGERGTGEQLSKKGQKAIVCYATSETRVT